MRSGVSIIDPTATWIDVQAEIAADAIIFPGTRISGATRIGADALVGPGEYADCEIGAGADVRHCVFRGASVPDGQALAPFTARGASQG